MRVTFRSLALELKNERSTPKPIVDVEIPLMLEQEPELPIEPWFAPQWKYVPTLLPAFEAEKAAALQGDDAAWEFSWLIRHAFFAESRTICMRHELETIARNANLDVDRFLRDWDGGTVRQAVLSVSRRGWDELQVPGSPTFILPSGKKIGNPGAVSVQWGPNHELLKVTPANCPNGDCLQVFREMLEEVVATPSDHLL